MPGGFSIVPEFANAADVGSQASTSYGTTMSASSNAYGAWVQLTASSPIDASWIAIQVNSNGGWFNWMGSFNVGIGGAGSEVALFTDLTSVAGTGRVPQTYLFPCSIPAGTRIAAQAANSGTGTSSSCNVAVTLFDASFSPDLGCAGADSFGFIRGTTFMGTQIDPGAVANTKSAWVQLIASTPRDYCGFSLAADDQNNNVNASQQMVDIGIGGAGSEVVILPNLQMGCIGATMSNSPCGPFWLPIPVGTRIAARSQSPQTTNRVFGLTGYGIYK